MIEIRKTIILRETVFSELGVEASRPTTRAVGMAVIQTDSPVGSSRISDRYSRPVRCSESVSCQSS